MKSRVAQTLSQNQTLPYTTELMAIFVIFWPILAKKWLPWQRPLDPCNQKCRSSLDWSTPQNPRTKNFVNSCYTTKNMSI